MATRLTGVPLFFQPRTWLPLALAALTSLSGCAPQQRVSPEIATPNAGWTAPLALDIENFNGRVSIRVDPAVAAPVVTASVYTSMHLETDRSEAAAQATSNTTQTEEQDGRAVLHVKSETTWPEPEQVWVDIDIVTPRCDGLRVFNRGGKVDISGITGAVLVDNGEYADEPGPIELRTGKPMTDPVALLTTAGSVFYQVGEGSTGRFDLQSADHQPEMDCAILRMSEVHADSRGVTAVIGQGENPVQLRSGRGRVRAFVMEHAGEYTNKFR